MGRERERVGERKGIGRDGGGGGERELGRKGEIDFIQVVFTFKSAELAKKNCINIVSLKPTAALSKITLWLWNLLSLSI